MGYYCGLPPARTEEERRTAPERHAKLQAEHDARMSEVLAEQAHWKGRRRDLSWRRRLLCWLRVACKRPDGAGWDEWRCRHCGRHAL